MITSATIERVSYGPAFDVPNTTSVRRCKVYIGRHHVADLECAGKRLYVMGLYSGNAIEYTKGRAALGDLVREVAGNAPRNPRDCQPDCDHN